MLKKILLKAISTFGIIWKILPFPIRKRIFFGLFILETRGKSKSQSLKRIFQIEDYLNLVVNERALALGHGEHPKHYLTRYHDFFIDNLNDCLRIADLGCGYGAVSRSIAFAYPNSIVIGIDNNTERLKQAKGIENPSNLQFELLDIDKFSPKQPMDGIVLSNVLEHVEERVNFLKNMMIRTNPKKVLIRVPLFERHWTIPLRKELGVNYFQDEDHKIEHTILEFENEMTKSGLYISKIETKWGEIWAVCLPILNSDE